MKKIAFLFLCALTASFASCSDDKTPGETTEYRARMSYTFRPAGDLTKVAREIELVWRATDATTGSQLLTDGGTWTQTFTSDAFPAESGFEVRVRMKDEAALTEPQYVLAYTYSYLLEMVDQDGNVATTVSLSESPSLKVQKENLWGTITLLNEDLRFYYRLYRDGRHEKLPAETNE